VHAEERLILVECACAECVDFFDPRVGHGKASDGYSVAMHHEERASSIVGSVITVGVANIEG